MPLASILPFLPSIIGGVGAIGGAASASAQNRRNRKYQTEQNQKDREFAREQYAVQRGDALSDWAREAAYNSPEQQMNRLRQAGLNPHLVYGKGADATMGSVSSSNYGNQSQQAPQDRLNPVTEGVTMGGTLAMQTQNVLRSQAETDNLHKLNQVYTQDALLKAAQTSKTMQDTFTGEFALNQQKAMNDEIIKRQQLINNQIISDTQNKQAQTNYTITQDNVAKLMAAPNKQKVLNEILLSKLQQAKTEQEVENIKRLIKLNESEDIIKQYEIDLNKKGTSKSDPAYQQIFMRGINMLFETFLGN